MTKWLKSFAVVVLCAGAWGTLATPAGAQEQFEVRAVAAEVTVQGNYVTATFKIEVANKETTPLTNVFVTFSDGATTSLGDVAAGATIQSEPQTRMIDRSNGPQSSAIPLPVTVQFSYGEQAVQVERLLAVTAQ
jgi:hypothetical protein